MPIPGGWSGKGISRRQWLHASVMAPVWGCLHQALAQDSPALENVHDRLVRMAENAPLTLRFEGQTAAECELWQETFGGCLRRLLGPFHPPEQWETRLERQVELADHVRQELILEASGQPPLPLYLLTPRSLAAQKVPAILALHGHGAHGYDPVAGRDDLPGVAEAIAEANYDYGRQLVRRGYVVAVPCFTPFGRRVDLPASYGGEDVCAVTFIRMQLLGKVLMAENLRDALWAFEVLRRQPAVDPERIGCVGLSYGGRMTMLTAAIEKRIRVAVVSGALNVMQERVRLRYSCGAQVIPGLLQYGDVPEILSLIAPRPCLLEMGMQDSLIPADWAESAFERIRRAYRAYGAEASLELDRFDGAHRWNGVRAYPFLAEALR